MAHSYLYIIGADGVCTDNGLFILGKRIIVGDKFCFYIRLGDLVLSCAAQAFIHSQPGICVRSSLFSNLPGISSITVKTDLNDFTIIGNLVQNNGVFKGYFGVGNAFSGCRVENITAHCCSIRPFQHCNGLGSVIHHIDRDTGIKITVFFDDQCNVGVVRRQYVTDLGCAVSSSGPKII